MDNPRVIKLQHKEHSDHARWALSQYRKQKKKKEKNAEVRSIAELSRAIDTNTKAISKKLSLLRRNACKRKAQAIETNAKKRQRVTLGKYRVKKVKCTEKASFLKCYNRRGGPSGLIQTHDWFSMI
ncbi:hypothetical protein PSHT_11220 [Puccinia striiformis]|uniref:Uncharacterized protein n=1 Tax=Puccinia striiformis TaxID=27350 RepID=A0A2S4V4N5_9BASI|nr:hypothetical protein PSHT_11220 [Puccinia striiformis]